MVREVEAVTAGILVIAGSAAPEARAQLERLAEAGALVLTLTREAVLTQDETLLMALRSAAGAALKQGRHVIVRSENWPGAAEVTRRLAAKRYIPAEEVERRVRTMLARVAEGVVKAAATRRLVAVGTEVGDALCAQLGITERQVVGEAAPGLVVWRAMVANDPVFLVLQPGSKGAPETLRQAVATLAGL
jgi:uncharacterized protein YgbK (DUF1537 family)